MSENLSISFESISSLCVYVCVCVCVCKREREREREREKVCMCVLCVYVCVCVRERERERENEPLSLLLLLLPPSLLYLANLGEISPLRTVKDLPDEERGRKPGDGRTAYFLPPYSSRARTSVETVAPFASAAASDQANERGGEVTLYLADFADNVKSNLLSATFVVPRY